MTAEVRGKHVHDCLLSKARGEASELYASSSLERATLEVCRPAISNADRISLFDVAMSIARTLDISFIMDSVLAHALGIHMVGCGDRGLRCCDTIDSYTIVPLKCCASASSSFIYPRYQQPT